MKKVNTVFCLFILLTLFSLAFTQTPKQPSDEKIKQAGEAGDKFVKRFRETLDFGIVFDEMASKKAWKLQEKFTAEFASVSRTIFNQQNEKTKEQLFKALMNSNYINYAFLLTFLNERDKKKPDFFLPPGYHKLVKKFKFLDGFSEWRESKKRIPVQNEKDLQIYLKELDTWCSFLKKHLPKKFYTHRLYKKNLKDTVLIPKVTDLDGDSQLEIPEGTYVFQVIRDMFCIDFIEEDGQMKILAMVIGN